ncbi:MAG: NADH-quinone oxidoreductase subunit NuoH [Chloroflexota bacterium]
MEWINLLVIPVVLSGILIFVLLTGFAYLSFIERKVVAKFTMRVGPNRAGPFGLLQPAADGIKMAFKEELMPSHVDKVVYILAPALAVSTALLAWAVLPIASHGLDFFGWTIPPYLADVNVALLYILATAGIGAYGVVLAGWASNNKYSLLGGLRTSAQIISYEIPMGIMLVMVLMIAGSMRMTAIIDFQVEHGWLLFFFPTGPFAFVVFYICVLAEANRAPFDLPETENELVSGYLTEYGGIRFALFFMGEYIHMITLSALTATLFLGGWHGPLLGGTFSLGLPDLNETLPVVGFILGLIYYILKIAFLLFLMMWVRASIPRVRYDKLMQFCWKFLLPVSLGLLAISAVRLVLIPLG